jgi:hypothetical protein
LNSEDMNDAELDAFLKGEDELSRRLKALEQPSPSAELDAAILAQAQRPEAANDASDGVASKAPMQRLGLRWRVPAGIAATVLAGVLAHQAWQASADLDRAREVSGVAPAPALPAPPVPQQPAAIEHSPVPQAKVSPPAPKPRQPAVQRSAPQVSDAPPPPPPSPPPPPVESYSYSAPAAAAPAPPPAAAAPLRFAEERRTVEVTGRRNRVEVQGPVVGRSSTSGELAAQPDPKIWLAAIEEMMKAGLQRDALEEWDKFRAAWPDYPVPAETREKINALRK